MNRHHLSRLGEVIRACLATTGKLPAAVYLSEFDFALLPEQVRCNPPVIGPYGVPIKHHELYREVPQQWPPAPAWWRTPERERPMRKTQ